MLEDCLSLLMSELCCVGERNWSVASVAIGKYIWENLRMDVIQQSQRRKVRPKSRRNICLTIDACILVREQAVVL